METFVTPRSWSRSQVASLVELPRAHGLQVHFRERQSLDCFPDPIPTSDKIDLGLEQAQEVAWKLVKAGQKEEGDALPDLVSYPKQKSFPEKIAEAFTSSDQGKNTISLSSEASGGGLVGVVREILQGSGVHDVVEAWSAAAKVGEVLRVAQGRGGDVHGVQMRADTDTRL